jgi:hypothetical protein
MRVDPRVAKSKFENEVSILSRNRAALEERGIFVLGLPTYPLIDVLFVPKNTVLAGAAMEVPGGPEPVNINVMDLPALTGRAFRVRLDLTDYDLQAPSVEFRDQWTSELIPYETIFRAQEYEPTRGAHVVLLDDHPLTHKPFLCLRGVREYHEHPQHSGDDWMLYRRHMNVFSLLQNIWRVSVDLVRPMLVLTPSAGQLQWLINQKP